MLVRIAGRAGTLGVALFDSEEAMRKADEAMKRGAWERRQLGTSVDFEPSVPLHTLERGLLEPSGSAAT